MNTHLNTLETIVFKKTLSKVSTPCPR